MTLDLSLRWQVLEGDWRDYPEAFRAANACIMDPPYGIGYQSNSRSSGAVRQSIRGDADTTERDDALALWGDRPALVFGSWKRPRPAGTHTLLVWDTKGALGMGDLSVPWKPSHQEVYVLGHGFTGPRGTDVLRYAPVQAMASNGRVHPHQKPVDLLVALLEKCPREWLVLDTFAGSGSLGVACVRTGHAYIGIEIDGADVAIARRRIADAAAQGNLFG